MKEKTGTRVIYYDDGKLTRIGNAIYFTGNEFKKPYMQVAGEKLYKVDEDGQTLIGIIEEDVSEDDETIEGILADEKVNYIRVRMTEPAGVKRAMSRSRDVIKADAEKTSCPSRTMSVDSDPGLTKEDAIRWSRRDLEYFKSSETLVCNIAKALAITLLILTVALFVQYEQLGERNFYRVWEKVGIYVCIFAPLILTCVSFFIIRSEDLDISENMYMGWCLTVYLSTLAFCIMLVSDDYADFVYDMIPLAGIGCDAVYYLIVAFMIMIPVTFLPLLLRFSVNGSNCGSCSYLRYRGSTAVYVIAAVMTVMVVIGRDVVTEGDVLSGIFAVVLLLLFQILPILLSRTVWYALC